MQAEQHRLGLIVGVMGGRRSPRAPIARAWSRQQPVARLARALLQPGRRLRACPDERRVRDAEPFAERAPTARRLGRALGPQAVIDGRRGDRVRRAAPPIRRPSARSAVESGPPETAISADVAASSGASSASTSAATRSLRLGRAPRRSTMILGHLALGEPLHRSGRVRIALAEFGEGRAGLLRIAERGQRLAEPHHALGRARRLGVVGRDLEILLGRLARARALEIGLADVEDRVGGQAMAADWRP